MSDSISAAGPQDENTPDKASPPLPAAGLGLLLLPLLGLGAATALIAFAAAIAGFYREPMLLAAAAVGSITALPALFLFQRQRAERMRSQRELDEVRLNMQGIVESAMDAIVTVDESQSILQFNAAAERVFRWPRSAVQGRKLDMLLPERFRVAHADRVRMFGETRTASRGMGSRGVLHGLRADGDEFPLEASISQHSEGGRKFFTVILRDLTGRQRSEEMLERSETRLRGILESAMDAIITVDERQHILLFNKAAERVFDCPREEAIGAPLAWFIPQRFRASHSVQVQAFGDAGVTSRRMGEQRVVMALRRSGEEFPIEASISQVTEHGQRLYTVILRDVAERVRQAEALARSSAQNRELSLASARLLEEEKSRIARELHDELGQALTALKLDVGWLRQQAGSGEPAVQKKLLSMQLLLDGTVAATRRISSDLRPLVLDDLGLAAAADWLAQNFTTRTGIACDLEVGMGFEELADPHATTFFRALQETLNNIAKHAEAKRVQVSLAGHGESMTLVVRDDGKGFVADGPRPSGTFGMLGLRERAHLLGGELIVESEPGRGTMVEMRLPRPAPGSTS